MANTSVPASGEAVPKIYPDIERRDGTLFFAVHEGNRKEISTSIERLIDMLDEMDGDPDLEETGDEHDTGMPEGWRGTSTYAAFGTYLPAGLDSEGPILEDDEDGNDAEPDEDGEPLLGWPEHRKDQIGGHGLGYEGEEFSAAGQCGIWSKSTSQDDDDEDGGDTELNGDEADYNGDEGDYSNGL